MEPSKWSGAATDFEISNGNGKSIGNQLPIKPKGASTKAGTSKEDEVNIIVDFIRNNKEGIHSWIQSFWKILEKGMNREALNQIHWNSLRNVDNKYLKNGAGIPLARMFSEKVNSNTHHYSYLEATKNPANLQTPRNKVVNIWNEVWIYEN